MASTPPKLSPQVLAWREAHRDDSQASSIVTVNVILPVLITIVTMARVASRRISKAGLGLDDYTLLLAAFLTYGLCINAIVATQYGMGRRIFTLSPAEVQNTMRSHFTLTLIYTASITTIKLSILSLYYRLFATRTNIFRWAVFATAGLTIAIGTSGFFALLFQCRPVRAVWIKFPNAKCLNKKDLTVVPGILNIITDFAILVLPLPIIWNLQIARWRKAALTGVFGLGGFACAISIIRIVNFFVKTGRPSWLMDITWDVAMTAGIWSTLEPAVGIICACLPLMGPLTRRLAIGKTVRQISSRWSSYSRKLSTSTSGNKTSAGSVSRKSSAWSVPQSEDKAVAVDVRERERSLP
ncbi:MAG: Suppressor of Sensor Kinase (SLN1) [Watsoniomyces obsoletus]|nr:MAG: Suppressor of Sensor Kinase (SLN1) [Watsoniomyces obsoletus]